jgi:hypothetical protein
LGAGKSFGKNIEQKQVVRSIMKYSFKTKLFSGLGLCLALQGATAKAAEGVTVYTMDNAIAPITF